MPATAQITMRTKAMRSTVAPSTCSNREVHAEDLSLIDKQPANAVPLGPAVVLQSATLAAYLAPHSYG